MNVVQLVCAGAGTLVYEPEGLLLRSCLLPANGGHTEHLLTFQLGYLGPGEISVVIALEGSCVGETGSLGGLPVTAKAQLWGTELGVDDLVSMAPPSPSVSLLYAPVPDAEVRYRYTILSESAASDGIRGEVVTEVFGRVPVLTATTWADITKRPIPDLTLPGGGPWQQSSCLVASRSR